MVGGYLIWQFGIAPAWLLELSWNLQRVLWRYFSVPVMLRTLGAHWHRDAVGYNRGGLEEKALALAWNLISRGIGLIIRSAMLALWLFAATLVLAISILAFVLLIAWPVISLLGLIAGVGGLIN